MQTITLELPDNGQLLINGSELLNDQTASTLVTWLHTNYKISEPKEKALRTGNLVQVINQINDATAITFGNITNYSKDETEKLRGYWADAEIIINLPNVYPGLNPIHEYPNFTASVNYSNGNTYVVHYNSDEEIQNISNLAIGLKEVLFNH